MTGEMMKQLAMDRIRVAFVIPFPGTKSYKLYKHKIVKGFDDFTGDTPMMPSDYMNVRELQDASKQLVSNYYNSVEYDEFVNSKIKCFPRLKESFDRFFRIPVQAGHSGAPTCLN